MTVSFKSKSTLDRTFEALLGREIQKLNTHLPKQRRLLSELLKSGDPAIETVDGSSILLRIEELEEVGKIAPEEYHAKLRLPMVILRRMELGSSIYTIAEERVEEFTVKKILGITQLDYHQIHLDQRRSSSIGRRSSSF